MRFSRKPGLLAAPRMMRALLLSIACIAATKCALAGAVPDLTLRDLAGQQQKLSRLRGSIVVMSFWATWCAPCREELPRLTALRETYKGKPVVFLAVSIDETKDRAKIAPYLEQAGVQLQVWTGADTGTMERYGLHDIVPSTLILDERGEAVVRIEGEAQDADVRTPVDWLLQGRSGAAPVSHVRRY